MRPGIPTLKGGADSLVDARGFGKRSGRMVKMVDVWRFTHVGTLPREKSHPVSNDTEMTYGQAALFCAVGR